MGASQSVRRTDRINLLDLGSYKYPVRRLCNGVDQCSEYQRMVKERAEIELKYAITLRDWAEKWEKIIAKGPENGTVKEVWQSHMKEARDVARFHDNCSQRIREEVIPHIKKWKHENYHKTKLHFNLKEISRAKKGFWRAQKPWKRKSKQVNSYKKAYHKACKMYDRRRQAVTDMATGNNPDPDDTRLAKRREKMRKAESAYNGSLRELLMPRYRDVYKNDMYMEFRKCQEAEGNRIKNLLETIHKYKEAVDLTNQRYMHMIPWLYSYTRLIKVKFKW